MRPIDADALEREYRDQFDSVYKNIRDSVNPADFYIERKASYDKKLVKLEMEAFFEYLHNRPTIDAVPVVRCKDCKRWGTGDSLETENVKCCENLIRMFHKNGYYVYGEVKDNDI